VSWWGGGAACGGRGGEGGGVGAVAERSGLCEMVCDGCKDRLLSVGVEAYLEGSVWEQNKGGLDGQCVHKLGFLDGLFIRYW